MSARHTKNILLLILVAGCLLPLVQGRHAETKQQHHAIKALRHFVASHSFEAQDKGYCQALDMAGSPGVVVGDDIEDLEAEACGCVCMSNNIQHQRCFKCRAGETPKMIGGMHKCVSCTEGTLDLDAMACNRGVDPEDYIETLKCPVGWVPSAIVDDMLTCTKDCGEVPVHAGHLTLTGSCLLTISCKTGTPVGVTPKVGKPYLECHTKRDLDPIDAVSTNPTCVSPGSTLSVEDGVVQCMKPHECVHPFDGPLHCGPVLERNLRRMIRIIQLGEKRIRAKKTLSPSMRSCISSCAGIYSKMSECSKMTQKRLGEFQNQQEDTTLMRTCFATGFKSHKPSDYSTFPSKFVVNSEVQPEPFTGMVSPIGATHGLQENNGNSFCRLHIASRENMVAEIKANLGELIQSSILMARTFEKVYGTYVNRPTKAISCESVCMGLFTRTHNTVSQCIDTCGTL